MLFFLIFLFSYDQGYSNQQFNSRSQLTASLDNSSFNPDDEPPLLDELGIYPDHIWGRTKLVTHLPFFFFFFFFCNFLKVLNPLGKPSNNSFLEDRDVAGPLVFCVILGVALLMTGKMYLGYIFGVGVMGSIGIYMLLHLMTEHTLDIYQVISVLGYCLLPIGTKKSYLFVHLFYQ